MSRFYKETLQGETSNYIHIRAQNERKSPIDVLSEIGRELVLSSNAIYMILESKPDALAAWKAVERGYM